MAPFANVSGDPSSPFNPSVHGPSNVLVFSSYERRGVIAMGVAGVFSCSLVSTLLLYIFASALLQGRPDSHNAPTPFIKKQVAVFVLSLLLSDLIQSVSGILQVKWAAGNAIYEGTACSVQAATLVMGDLGSTIWSCVIAVHTFSGLALGKQWSRASVIAVVTVGWLTALILTIIGPIAFENQQNGPFYGIAGEWCFITSSYSIQRLIIHYVPLFTAAVVILTFYGLLFFVLRGTITFTSHRIKPAGIPYDDDFMRERITIAKRMLWYPIAYLTCIFPIATIRLAGLWTDRIPLDAWFFAMFTLFSLGAVDSVIYATTRHLIKPIRKSMLMSTANSDASTARAATPADSPKKSEFTDVSDGSRTPQASPDKDSLWDEESAQNVDEIHEVEELKPGTTGIRVTQEQIQQVI